MVFSHYLEQTRHDLNRIHEIRFPSGERFDRCPIGDEPGSAVTTTHDQKEVNMKTRNRFSTNIMLMFACLILALPTMASSVVYDNGPPNFTIDAWTINFGYQVQDTFYLGAQTQITGADFYVWEFPGDSMSSVDWLISGGASVGGVNKFGTADLTNSKKQGLLQDTLWWGGGWGYQMDQISLTDLRNWDGTSLNRVRHLLALHCRMQRQAMAIPFTGMRTAA